MGEIRSALDIALEKTANIQGDKTSADNRELKNAGKKAAGDYLTSGDKSKLEKIAAEKTEAHLKLLQEGALSIFLAGLHLPTETDDLKKVSAIGSGIDMILPKAGMKELFGQIEQIFVQYLSEREQLSKALEQQFLPRLRAKQQEMEKRYGKSGPIDPSRDPEYISALSKNQRMIDAKYEQVVTEVRTRVRQTAGIEE